VGAALALGGDLESPQGGPVSQPPAPPLLLASTSPQRRAILGQLGLPFDVVAPRYEERAPETESPAELVREHALGKARSVAGEAGERPVVGVDTIVHYGGRVFGKPRTAEEAAGMLGALSGDVHEVVSGLALVTPGWDVVEDEVTRVRFRALTARDIATYVAAGEWEGRAGGYAIQGLGAALVERIEGDYLNVVGLPAAVLVRLLAERFAGTYGFG
jgi:septum formation protein